MGFSVDCVCDPSEKNGYKYVQWIGSIFGDCIYTPLEKFSYYSGVISILFYFIAFYPQIYENYRRKTTEGLSLLLIIIWLFGDFANFAGTVLTEQYPIQKVVGVYFALMEVIIVGQYLYYKFFYKGPNVISNEDDDEPTENDPLIIKTDANESINKGHHKGNSPQLTYETFSDIQKVPIHPPSDPVDGNDATPKVNASVSSNPRDIDAISPQTNSTHVNSTLSGSVNSGASKQSKKDLEPEIIPENIPVPVAEEAEEEEEQKQKEPKVEEDNHEDDNENDQPKYETLDEVSQKQQEQEQTQPQEESKPEEDIPKPEEEEDDDDEDDVEESVDFSSKDTSQLSLDTRNDDDDDDDEDGGISRSESSLNKKKKKKGRKGKKGKKGRKQKRGKGLSTIIQTIALLSLFIIQIQAKAIEYQNNLHSFDDHQDDGTPSDEAPQRICDASPNLSILQKVLGSLMAWSSGILYFTCRIPQILDNKRNRSVEGLSIFLFVCTILGNLFYSLSILTRFPPIDTKFFAATLPYLIGSIGTFIFDIMIIYQFNIYKDTGVTYSHIE